MMLNNNNSKQKLISAQDIVKKYQITYQTVNHYTNFGLLSVITKRGNVRMYNETKVKQRLVKIMQLMNEGYPLRLIRKQLEGI